jgi:hypothetical protein
METTQKPLIFDCDYIEDFKKPQDCLEYTQKIGGVCGLASIAGLLGVNVLDIFNTWEKDSKDFRHFTSQKEMKHILSKCGFKATQKSIGKNKVAIPNIDFGIIRVSFGEQNQHWMITAKNSHYIAIKKMSDDRRYIFDNGFENFNDKPVNGMWIEVSEYWVKIAMQEKMFVTSYLDVKQEGGLAEERIAHNGIPPKDKSLGILPTIL